MSERFKRKQIFRHPRGSLSGSSPRPPLASQLETKHTSQSECLGSPKASQQETQIQTQPQEINQDEFRKSPTVLEKEDLEQFKNKEVAELVSPSTSCNQGDGFKGFKLEKIFSGQSQLDSQLKGAENYPFKPNQLTPQSYNTSDCSSFRRISARVMRDNPDTQVFTPVSETSSKANIPASAYNTCQGQNPSDLEKSGAFNASQFRPSQEHFQLKDETPKSNQFHREEKQSHKSRDQGDDEDKSADIDTSSLSSHVNVFKRRGGNLMIHMSEGHSQVASELEQDAVITPENYVSRLRRCEEVMGDLYAPQRKKNEESRGRLREVDEESYDEREVFGLLDQNTKSRQTSPPSTEELLRFKRALRIQPPSEKELSLNSDFNTKKCCLGLLREGAGRLQMTEAQVSVFRAARVERAQFSFSANEEEDQVKEELEQSHNPYRRQTTLNLKTLNSQSDSQPDFFRSNSYGFMKKGNSPPDYSRVNFKRKLTHLDIEDIEKCHENNDKENLISPLEQMSIKLSEAQKRAQVDFKGQPSGDLAQYLKMLEDTLISHNISFPLQGLPIHQMSDLEGLKTKRSQITDHEVHQLREKVSSLSKKNIELKRAMKRKEREFKKEQERMLEEHAEEVKRIRSDYEEQIREREEEHEIIMSGVQEQIKEELKCQLTQEMEKEQRSTLASLKLQNEQLLEQIHSAIREQADRDRLYKKEREELIEKIKKLEREAAVSEEANDQLKKIDITPTHSDIKLQDLQLHSDQNEISRTEMGVQTLIPVAGLSPNLNSNPSFGDYREETSEFHGVENLEDGQEEQEVKRRQRFNNSNESLVSQSNEQNNSGILDEFGIKDIQQTECPLQSKTRNLAGKLQNLIEQIEQVYLVIASQHLNEDSSQKERKGRRFLDLSGNVFPNHTLHHFRRIDASYSLNDSDLRHTTYLNQNEIDVHHFTQVCDQEGVERRRNAAITSFVSSDAEEHKPNYFTPQFLFESKHSQSHNEKILQRPFTLQTKQSSGKSLEKPSPKIGIREQLKKKELTDHCGEFLVLPENTLNTNQSNLSGRKNEYVNRRISGNVKIECVPPPRISNIPQNLNITMEEEHSYLGGLGEENLVQTSTLEGGVESARRLFDNV